jgi:hypothetical protein
MCRDEDDEEVEEKVPFHAHHGLHTIIIKPSKSAREKET